jgi:hypothetical protein
MRVFFFLLCCTVLFADFSKTIYPLSPDPIDVVIPCHPKDCKSLKLCIKAIRKYGINVRRIVVVSSKPLTEHAEWFDESNYPFDKADILAEIFQDGRTTHPRIGWLYQQFLKLYAFLVIPDLSPNILILDADTIFLKVVQFMTMQGDPLFNVGKEHWEPYFSHAKRLLPDFYKVSPKLSGITHHMLFQKPILEDLFQQIENIHAVEPWKAIARCICPKDMELACFSEYELYFNFALLRTDQPQMRKLKWKNIKLLNEMKRYKKLGYDYVSCHVYD